MPKCNLCDESSVTQLVYNGKPLYLCEEHWDFVDCLKWFFDDLMISQQDLIKSNDVCPDDLKNARALKKIEMLVLTNDELLKEVYLSWKGEDFGSK